MIMLSCFTSLNADVATPIVANSSSYSAESAISSLETTAGSASYSMDASVTTASILENSTQEASLSFNSFLVESSAGTGGGGGCLLKTRIVEKEQ
jgi:hypothetical protein